MFNKTEQRTLTELAKTMRRIAGHIEAVATIPSGAESSVIDILEDAEKVVRKQADMLALVISKTKSRQ